MEWKPGWSRTRRLRMHSSVLVVKLAVGPIVSFHGTTGVRCGSNITPRLQDPAARFLPAATIYSRCSTVCAMGMGHIKIISARLTSLSAFHWKRTDRAMAHPLRAIVAPHLASGLVTLFGRARSGKGFGVAIARAGQYELSAKIACHARFAGSRLTSSRTYTGTKNGYGFPGISGPRDSIIQR